MAGSWRIRRAKIDDGAQMYAVFADSIRVLTSEEYTPRQQVAWIQSAGPEYFRSLIALEQHDIWVAEWPPGRVAGFVALHFDDLSYLYVRPDSSYQGLGTQLLQHAEHTALSRGENMLYLRSSVTARPFYEKKGFQVVERTIIRRQGVDIPTVKMVKALRAD